MFIRNCPICTSELWHGTEPKLNLYGCPTCGNIFKIQIVEPKPIEGTKTVKINKLRWTHETYSY